MTQLWTLKNQLNSQCYTVWFETGSQWRVLGRSSSQLVHITVISRQEIGDFSLRNRWSFDIAMIPTCLLACYDFYLPTCWKQQRIAEQAPISSSVRSSPSSWKNKNSIRSPKISGKTGAPENRIQTRHPRFQMYPAMPRLQLPSLIAVWLESMTPRTWISVDHALLGQVKSMILQVMHVLIAMISNSIMNCGRWNVKLKQISIHIAVIYSLYLVIYLKYLIIYLSVNLNGKAIIFRFGKKISKDFKIFS